MFIAHVRWDYVFQCGALRGYVYYEHSFCVCMYFVVCTLLYVLDCVCMYLVVYMYFTVHCCMYFLCMYVLCCMYFVECVCTLLSVYVLC